MTFSKAQKKSDFLYIQVCLYNDKDQEHQEHQEQEPNIMNTTIDTAAELAELKKQLAETKKELAETKKELAELAETKKEYFTGSKILFYSQHRKWLISNLRDSENKSGIMSTELLYTCDHYTKNAEEFHSSCDGKKGTLVVVRCTKGNVFGGYTTESWCGKDNDKKDDGFLFSLVNPEGVMPAKYEKKKGLEGIIPEKDYGPYFWDDMCLWDKYGNSYVEFPENYEDTTGRGYGDTFTNDVFFKIDLLEVWSVVYH